MAEKLESQDVPMMTRAEHEEFAEARQADIDQLQAEAKVLNDDLAAALARAGEAELEVKNNEERLKQEFQQELQRIVNEANDKLLASELRVVAAEKARGAAEKEQARHLSLEKLHWQHVQALRDNDAPAALELFREIRRLELVGQRASLDAQEKEIGK